MDKHYSKIYSYDYSKNMKNQLFRYNYETYKLEKVCIPGEELLADLKEDLNSRIGWLKAEAQANLKSYEETGYVVITAEGLSKESWEEDKDYYMDMMCENIAYEISDAIKEFAPEIAEKEGKEMKTAKDTSLASELNELAKGLDYYEYMDNYNSEEEGLQYFIESLNNQEQTKVILDHLRGSQEETPEIWGPKELEVLQHLEKYASQQFPDMFSISEEDITKLVKAGDWHIDEVDHNRFVMGDEPKFIGDIGYVSFGNYIYDLSCVDFNPANSNFTVDIFERRPVDDIGQTTNILSQEGRLYTFEAIDVDELTEKYLQDGSDNYTLMDRNEYNSRGLDEFKRDIVKALATATAIDSKGFKYHLPFIEPKYAEAYTALKESGQGFPQYYEKQRKVLEHLADFEYNPNKFKWYLPGDTKQLIHSEKLSPEQIDILGGYYDHFRECYHDNKLDYVANKRMLVRKMINDGLSDSRITAINDSIFDRFERYTTSVSKPQFNQVVSDLIKETRTYIAKAKAAEEKRQAEFRKSLMKNAR